MSNNDDPELRYSCLNESIQVLHSNPHSLTLTDKRLKGSYWLTSLTFLIHIQSYIDIWNDSGCDVVG